MLYNSIRGGGVDLGVDRHIVIKDQLPVGILAIPKTALECNIDIFTISCNLPNFKKRKRK